MVQQADSDFLFLFLRISPSHIEHILHTFNALIVVHSIYFQNPVFDPHYTKNPVGKLLFIRLLFPF